MWPRVLLSVLSLSWIARVSAEPQYVLLVPAVVRSDFPQTACLQLRGLGEPLALSILLEYGSSQETLLEESVAKKDFFKCKEFKVPPATSDPLAFISFSAKGITVNFSERRSVAIQNVDNTVLIQTDKPIYKPEQKVMFRVVALDSQFRPVQETYPRIIIKDPEQNTIFQWLEVTSKHGIAQLSFPLIPEPILGPYRITVEKRSGAKEHQIFWVQEYVLPKFEVTTSVPQRISFFDEEVRVKVCALYTYGQPVQGNARVSVCQERFHSPRCLQSQKETCEALSGQLGKDGCLQASISIRALQLYRSYARMYASLAVESSVTESGTGIQMKNHDYVAVSQENERAMFRNMDFYYKRGIPYHGEILVTNGDDKPVAGRTVVLELNEDYLANYTTDRNGIAAFSIDTSNFFDPTFKLRVRQAADECGEWFSWRAEEEPLASFSVRRFYSRSGSFVKIQAVQEKLSCGHQQPINIHYVLNREGYSNASHTGFYYLVMAKGKIILSGQKQVSISGAPRGTFSIRLSVTEKFGPTVRLLVYTVHPQGEIVADSSWMHSSVCFKNQLQLEFSQKQGLPGSKVNLHLEAAANSYCALKAVDQSVLLLQPAQELSAERVYYQLHVSDLYGYYYNGLSLEDEKPQQCTPTKTTFWDGLYYQPVNVSGDGDVYRIFRDMGLKVFTNALLRKPVLCNEGKPDEEDHPAYFGHAGVPESGYAMDESRVIGGAGGSAVNSVRKFFPETWIWDLVQTDSKGEVNASYTLPDTITEWTASAFCVQDDAGFGISSPVSLTAFQPFFVDLTLPHSVIRGESFNLIANVFNYLSKCIQVSVTLAQSSDYKAEGLSPEGNTARLCAKERKTYLWAVTPHKLGEVKFTVAAEALLSSRGMGNGTSPEEEPAHRDTLIQTLLVEPEGIKKELTQSSLICTEGVTRSEPVSLSLPRNLVQGSARAYLSVNGDILGTALRNLENLLHMPYGCGEQNMALFTPNIYALDYLNKTGQLSEETRARGTGYLAAGYQKQLSYKHWDGSYSSFGRQDREGSLWLTAFVYKSFAQARRYIYIDDKVQAQALIWLASKQKADGCFENAGSHFNNALKGGAEGEYSLTAYVVAALLEAGHSAGHPVVQSGMKCLETAFGKGVHSLYEQALFAYAYGLAGKEERRQFFLERLQETATRDGGSVYWQRENKPPAEHLPLFYPRAPSAEIEMTSYVLLASLHKAKLTPEELSYASRIVHWLVRQQNPYGGFSSSQDTVVALQALAQYGHLTFSKNNLNTVQVSSMDSPGETFQVEDRNRFLLQQLSLATTPGNYSLQVNGSGCVYLQTILRYNIHLPKEVAGFSLSVQPSNASCTGNFPPTFDLVLSASYIGNRKVSNMAIIDVKMLSGFVPVRSSLNQLQDQSAVVDHVDIKNNHVLFYLQKVSQKEISFSFSVEQSLPVSSIRAVPVHIYDYYETDEYALAEYTTPCSLPSN